MRVDVNGTHLAFDVDGPALAPVRTGLVTQTAAHIDFSGSADTYSARSQAVGEEKGEG